MMSLVEFFPGGAQVKFMKIYYNTSKILEYVSQFDFIEAEDFSEFLNLKLLGSDSDVRDDVFNLCNVALSEYFVQKW